MLALGADAVLIGRPYVIAAYWRWCGRRAAVYGKAKSGAEGCHDDDKLQKLARKSREIKLGLYKCKAPYWDTSKNPFPDEGRVFLCSWGKKKDEFSKN